MLHAFHQKHTKHIKNITWSQPTTLHCQNDRLYARYRTYEGRTASCCVLFSRLMFTSLSLCRSLCQKWELFLWSIGVKVNGQYCWISYYLNKVLDAIIALFITLCLSARQRARCILHSTQSNCCSAKLSTSFLLSSGPITVQSWTPLTEI